MIDTHCHLTSEDLLPRLGDVLEAARDAGVDRMLTIGTTPDDAAKAVAVAEACPHIYAAAGIHPHDAEDWLDPEAGREALLPLLRHHRVIAFGEMGLDLHYPDPPLVAQQQCFAWQLDLAREWPHLPIIIHNRKATPQTLAMIREAGLPGDRFVFHCFTGEADELDQILDLGAMVSLTGIVTFKSAGDLADATDRIPLRRLMVETDSPYLTPAPFRKIRPNEPRYVLEVARFLAERRRMSFEDFAAAVDANAERFFKWPSPQSCA